MSQINAKQNETNITELAIIISHNREYEQNRTMRTKNTHKVQGSQFNITNPIDQMSD